MYDIKQFRPALYVLILMGFAGYALAAQTVGLWAFCTLLVIANAWFIKIDLYRPMPRLMASIVTLVFFAYVFIPANDPSSSRGSLILVAGQILVLLQVVKVWEQRGNRDYAQLLVLSLLLMVAAAISTASLLFGLIFIAYLLLSLYCCLLFHLKVETDEARLALAIPMDSVTPATLRQDQRHLPRSMRRLTFMVAIFAVTFAVMVFVFFPRGTGAGMFQVHTRSPETMTGFTEHVDFQSVAKISQNDTQLAVVHLFKNEKPLGYAGPLMLRGITHDYYSGSDNSDRSQYQWIRTPTSHTDVTSSEGVDQFPLTAPAIAQMVEQIDIGPTGTPAIFSMPGPVSISTEGMGNNRPLSIRYSPIDESLQWSEAPNQRCKYSIVYKGSLGNNIPDQARPHSMIDPLITQYAQRPEVSGGLAAQRQAIATTQPSLATTVLDEQIARHIETHLRSTFHYTLDLTKNPPKAGQDPIVAFLYDSKSGHCEYFAGAMTLLCQSLGMEARMVVGFKCDEYNSVGDYYTVRQSHAHAWVEVLTPTGWKTFDPTSGHEAPASRAGLWQKTRQMLDYLEYTWQNAVIAYDSDNRENFIQNVDNRLANTTINSAAAVSGIQWFFNQAGEWLANKVAGPLIILLMCALIGSIGWFLYEHFKLRRRASRIGIQFLPASDQFRLVRQLAFYDQLLQLLDRHRIERPTQLTPLEFTERLSFLPSEVYDQIHRLTQLFYRIRYGHGQVTAAQQRRLAIVVARLAQALPKVRRA